MKIESITFTFENCECITIDGKYVGDFLVEDIRRCIKRIGCNAINKIDVAHTFVIELHKDANKAYYPFGIREDKTKAFDRFNKYNDITNVCFDLVDGYSEDKNNLHREHYDYDMNWSGDNDFSNESQKIYISDCGNLYIVINESGGIEDYFCMEEINDCDAMDFHFDMCDVGDKYGDPNRYAECS